MKAEECVRRVGLCRATGRRVVQHYDGQSDDASDEFGWLCLHDDTIEEEVQHVIKFIYGIDSTISSN
jgi:hypothetical protein